MGLLARLYPLSRQDHHHDDGIEAEKSPPAARERETLFVRGANAFFRRFGVAIARRPWTSLAISSMLTILAAAAIPFTPMSNDVSDFTPNGARARQEIQVYKEFFAGKGEPVALFVLIRAKSNHGGNMLGIRQLEETVRLLDTISTRFTVFDATTGRNETFMTLCNSFCTINEPIRHFYNGLLIKRNFGQNVTAEHIDLGYPITTVLGRQLHMDPNFFGVKVALDTDTTDGKLVGERQEEELESRPQTHAHRQHHGTGERVESVNQLRSINGHSVFDIGTAQLKDNIREIRVVGLQFRIERPPSISAEELKRWEFRIVHYLQQEFTSEFVEAYILSEGFLTAEVVRAGLTLLPFLVIGFVIMVVFSSISMNAAAFYVSQLYPHKSLLAFVACVCPFMACGTALGALFWAGFRFGSILCVTPFLVLALGVDDAFLMINSWQRLRRKQLKERPKWNVGIEADGKKCAALSAPASATAAMTPSPLLSAAPIPSEEAAARQRRVEHLLSAVMIDTGASITITTLTNVLAFSIGALTPTPEIQLFSIGNALAIIIDFIYEWTIFGAAMAIVGRWELAADDCDALGECQFLPSAADDRARDSAKPDNKETPHDNKVDLNNDNNNEHNNKKVHPAKHHGHHSHPHPHHHHYGHATRPASKRRGSAAAKKRAPRRSASERYSLRESVHVLAKCLHAKMDDAAPKFVRGYCALIANAYASSLVLVALAVYMYVCVYGVLNMRAELKPDRLFLQNSDVIQALGMRNDFIIPFYAICIVFVNQPGNLSDPLRLGRLHSLKRFSVSDFERLPSSVGQFSTKFWLRDYEKFVEENAGGAAPGGVNEIRQFLEWPEFSFWKGFLQLRDAGIGLDLNLSSSSSVTHDVHVQRFFFTTASYGPRLVEWSQREQLLNQWRAVADFYPELNVSIYEDDAKFLDLIPAMVPQTAQSSFWTLACMFLVCLLFIRHPTTLLVANFAIFSCCVGVFGILSLSGVDLDPIVMSSMIMSIGFSVDIPAHISYHFYKSGLTPAGLPEPTVEARLRHCIAAIGFPILEAGASTIVCVASLLLIDLHMARVFATTMILVVAIGLIHGLLVIPAIFYLISRLPTTWRAPGAGTDGDRSPASSSAPSSPGYCYGRALPPPPPLFSLAPPPPRRATADAAAEGDAAFTNSAPDGILSIRLRP